ncbi:MAG: hypothetical protein QXD89_01985 [Candidatus Aenigmatarchaeota archaeon]
MEEREKKVLAERYAKLQINLEAMLKEREEIEKKIEEIEETIEAIKELKIDKETVFSIGVNVFGFGKITSEKFLINVGANVGIETEKENSINILNKMKNNLMKILENIEFKVKKILEEQEKILTKFDEK